MSEGLTVLEAVLLGVVQGLTEWLPVSSSGHLVLTQHLVGLELGVFFDLVLHVGTLLVVLGFYRHTVTDVLRALAHTPQAYRATGSWRATLWADPHRRLAMLVVAGSVPTVLIGFTFEEVFLGLFDSLVVVGAALVATGTWLYLSRFAPSPNPYGGLTLVVALMVGTVQGLAIVPGVSRSGATIGMALLLGVQREEAVRFSFLLSVPAIVGATVFQADAAALSEAGGNLAAYALGTLAAIVVGYAALWLLVQLVRRRLFHQFAWYDWTVGAAVLVYALA